MGGRAANQDGRQDDGRIHEGKITMPPKEANKTGKKAPEKGDKNSKS